MSEFPTQKQEDFARAIEEDYCWNGDSREKHCPLREVEAIPKADYEEQIKINNKLVKDNKQLKAYITMMQIDHKARLKAEKVAMLTEIQLEIEESENCGKAFHLGLQMASNIIQQKIDKLEENTDGAISD